MFHKFSISISDVSLPEKFNNPFRYTPHRLSLMAADEVRAYIFGREEWQEELKRGKMFGVLVVRTQEGEIGFLSAYSGLLDGKNNHSYFVPAIYDLLTPQSYFQIEERNISLINKSIAEIEKSSEYKKSLSLYEKEIAASQKILSDFRRQMQESKALRDYRRSTNLLTSEEEALMIKESQFEKAEYKRLNKRVKEREEELKIELLRYEDKIKSLKQERKERSANLQEWLFRQFILLNAQGEEKDLVDIFYHFNSQIPPAGAGECAAPKMLQYAYKNNMQPICMAEFWVGESPVGEIRYDGNFYPSCKGKCLPILTYMLQGVDIEDDSSCEVPQTLDIVYSDDYLIAVNKPSGMLSSPGKIGGESVEEILQKSYPDVRAVHRLDMATSGVLLLAKDVHTYKVMQQLFASRRVDKQYVAIIDGVPQKEEGVISLPLSSDYANRPAQKVDLEKGKEAITKYKLLESYSHEDRICSRMMLTPITGRTHQLRVHMAHHLSLGMPIVGDELYGKPDKRLMLHAQSVAFIHPMTGEKVEIKVRSPF